MPPRPPPESRRTRNKNTYKKDLCIPCAPHGINRHDTTQRDMRCAERQATTHDEKKNTLHNPDRPSQFSNRSSGSFSTNLRIEIDNIILHTTYTLTPTREMEKRMFHKFINARPAASFSPPLCHLRERVCVRVRVRCVDRMKLCARLFLSVL